jgi:hypothetical protein
MIIGKEPAKKCKEMEIKSFGQNITGICCERSHDHTLTKKKKRKEGGGADRG